MSAKYPDELLADFQETYGLNLWAFDLDGDTTDDVLRVAALAYQLGPKSRTWAKVAPHQTNSDELRMLRDIEHGLRLWYWAHTNEAKDKNTAPEPVLLRGEEAAFEAAREHEKKSAADIAARLGIIT